VFRNSSRLLLRRRRVLAGISAACIAAGLALASLTSSSAASAASGSGIPAAAAQRLTAAAERAAAIDGDARPEWIEAVKTTRAAALRVATPGDTVPGSAGQIVYLVIMKGSFTLGSAPVPSGARAPAGQYLAITFGAVTFQAMDLGLSDDAPRGLRSLGRVLVLAQRK
jgi:hypothetical protein